MNMIELAKYLLDEHTAENYLIKNGILKTFTECPNCNSTSIGNIRRSRMKCYKCKKEWHKRSGSFLQGKHIESRFFIGILKMFSEGYGVIETANQLELNEKSVIELFDGLTSSLFRFFDIIPETFINSEFYLLQKNNEKIETRIISDLSLTKNDTFGRLKIERNRNLDLSYAFTCKLEWVHSSNRTYKNNIIRFMSFLKYHLAKYRGISQYHFQHYFGILLIRYNLKGKDIFDMIIDSLKIGKVAETTRC